MLLAKGPAAERKERELTSLRDGEIWKKRQERGGRREIILKVRTAQ